VYWAQREDLRHKKKLSKIPSFLMLNGFMFQLYGKTFTATTGSFSIRVNKVKTLAI